LDEFYGATRQPGEEIFIGGNHHAEVLGHLPARNAVHRQEACRPIGGQASVVARLEFESLRSGFLVEENEEFWVHREIASRAGFGPGVVRMMHGPFP
jgi:hypothetical protein